MKSVKVERYFAEAVQKIIRLGQAVQSSETPFIKKAAVVIFAANRKVRKIVVKKARVYHIMEESLGMD